MASHLPQRLGFVGLGAMGWPMATQLLANSSGVLTVFDVDLPLLHRFASTTPQGRVRLATSAKARTHVREVYLANNVGLLAGQTSSKIFIDSSTIDIETSLAVGEAVNDSNSENPPAFFDCPVSGGTAGASKGGTQNYGQVDKSNGQKRARFSSETQQQLSKRNNCSGNFGGYEPRHATRIDPRDLSNCFLARIGSQLGQLNRQSVPGVCPDAVTSKGYEGGFKVQLMEKDMKLAAAAAKKVGAKLVLGDTAIKAYSSTASDPRYRGKDSRVVYKWCVPKAQYAVF
ncbi:mitochondrial putative 3-hydroxyisobutyrate dehydrogenase [Favolaschia claudopus]|uniref:3-hydroxyisobutyrate dehydrogenase n=1 Tax=Favolaschia claudopus TaxID=2862362 RepID=A0AAW0DWG2_9AGAR